MKKKSRSLIQGPGFKPIIPEREFFFLELRQDSPCFLKLLNRLSGAVRLGPSPAGQAIQ